MNAYTIRDFEKQFPTDAACLDFLKNARWPRGIPCKTCGKITKHHRITTRACYGCDWCGTQVYPLAGTIFHKSPTALRSWFHAIFLMASTRCGISAKQMERELGVTYKTAWRMFNRIRSLLAENIGPLGGTVEVDETYIGGKRRYGSRKKAARAWSQEKQVVAGHAQRGGKLRAMHLPQGAANALVPLVRQHILPASLIYTDELPAYTKLG